jgi:hypothetical protein
VFPSTAFDAGNVAFSVDDAVAGLPCDSNVAALARLAGPATNATAAIIATTSPAIKIRRDANERRTPITTEPITNP